MHRDDLTAEAIEKIVEASFDLAYGALDDGVHSGAMGVWACFDNRDFRQSEEDRVGVIMGEELGAIIPTIRAMVAEATATATRRILDELPAIPLRDVSVDDVLAEIAAEAQRRRPRVAA